MVFAAWFIEAVQILTRTTSAGDADQDVLRPTAEEVWLCDGSGGWNHRGYLMPFESIERTILHAHR